MIMRTILSIIQQYNSNIDITIIINNTNNDNNNCNYDNNSTNNDKNNRIRIRNVKVEDATTHSSFSRRSNLQPSRPSVPNHHFGSPTRRIWSYFQHILFRSPRSFPKWFLLVARLFLSFFFLPFLFSLSSEFVTSFWISFFQMQLLFLLNGFRLKERKC